MTVNLGHFFTASSFHYEHPENEHFLSCLEDVNFPLKWVLFLRGLYNSIILGRASMLQAHDISVRRVDLTAFRFKNWMRRETIIWMPLISSWTWKTSDESSPNMSGAKLPVGDEKMQSGKNAAFSRRCFNMHDENHATPIFWRRFSFNDHPPVA